MYKWTILHYGDPNTLHIAIQNALWMRVPLKQISILRGDPEHKQTSILQWVEVQRKLAKDDLGILMPDGYYMNRINRFHVIQHWMLIRIVKYISNFDLLVLPSQQMRIETPTIPWKFAHEVPIYRDRITEDFTKSGLVVSRLGAEKLTKLLRQTTSPEIEAYYFQHQTITPYEWDYND